MSRSHRYTQSCSVVLAMWSLVPHTTTLRISWNGSAIVVDAIFANNLLQFRRQLRFVPSTTDIKFHVTANHRLTSVSQASTVAHPVHRCTAVAASSKKKSLPRFPEQEPFLRTVSEQSPLLSCASSRPLRIGSIRP